MNKLLHALIYILLAVTGTMLYFEIQLDKKRQLLGDRNLALENALVELASTIETNSPPRTKLESDQKCRIDISPIEANPEVSIVYSDILDDSYRAHLELNASGRAVSILGEGLPEEEMKGIRAVLRAAALTYVASALQALLQLARLLLLSQSRRRRD